MHDNGVPADLFDTATEPSTDRTADADTDMVEASLKDVGWADLGAVLDTTLCAEIATWYDQEDRFRSRVVMARHGFGSGEYKYFRYPLPAPIARLRASLYDRLVPVANAWEAALKTGRTFPAEHARFVDRCHAAGQVRPTPLLLRYRPGDYNCLHQDLYGAHVFPIQVVVLLSDPEAFDGGEFVMTEQRPRMQSRAEVVPLRRGHAVAFAVNDRPKQGGRGVYRVKHRHGVSRLRSGERFALGIIFHDAA